MRHVPVSDPDLELHAAERFRLDAAPAVPSPDDTAWRRLVMHVETELWWTVREVHPGAQARVLVRPGDTPWVLVEIPEHGDVTADAVLPERWLTEVVDRGEERLDRHFVAEVLDRDEEGRPARVLALRLLDDPRVWGATRWMHLAGAEVDWVRDDRGRVRPRLHGWDPEPSDVNELLGL